MSLFNWLWGAKSAPIDDNNSEQPTTEPKEILVEQEASPPEPCEAVSAQEVWSAFRVNQVAAEDRFQGQAFTVVGEVRTVQRDFHGRTLVNLAAESFHDLAVLFPEEARDQVTRLLPGAELRVLVRVKESGSRGDVKLEAVEAA